MKNKKHETSFLIPSLDFQRNSKLFMRMPSLACSSEFHSPVNRKNNKKNLGNTFTLQRKSIYIQDEFYQDNPQNVTKYNVLNSVFCLK